MDKAILRDKKLLLVDDEPELRQMLSAFLREAGCRQLRTAAFVREAADAVRDWEPDLAILDVMLPDGDGFSLLGQLRARSALPVIFLSARDEAEAVLKGLGLGADDYIAKPFSPEELLLRVCAVLRRCSPPEPDLLRLAACRVDFDRAQVLRDDGAVLPLTAMEHRLLKTLAGRAGKIVTVDALCQALWGDNPFGCGNSLNAHIRRVREKIEAEPSRPASLLTVKGLGYRLLERSDP